MSVQHPFYVCGKGWCSLAPGRTSQRYRGLGCKLLQVDDVCLSLTQRGRDAAHGRDSKRKASPYNHVSPPPESATPRRTTPRPNSSSSANCPPDQANSKHINRHLGKTRYLIVILKAGLRFMFMHTFSFPRKLCKLKSTFMIKEVMHSFNILS